MKIISTLICFLLTNFSLSYGQISIYAFSKAAFSQPTNAKRGYELITVDLYTGANIEAQSRTTDTKSYLGHTSGLGLTYKDKKISYLFEIGRTLLGSRTYETRGFQTYDNGNSEGGGLPVATEKRANFYYNSFGLGFQYDVLPKLSIILKGNYLRRISGLSSFMSIYFYSPPVYTPNSGSLVATIELDNQVDFKNNFTTELAIQHEIWNGIMVEMGYMRGITPYFNPIDRESKRYHQALTLGLKYNYDFGWKKRRNKN